MSNTPGNGTYRVSVKREPNGVVSSYIHDHLRAGDTLDVSAPRGGFTLRSGEGPVVLLSAGIGATPVLSMLHALSSAATHRDVWWIYGARNGREHPFAEESRGLLETLLNGRSHIVYSRPNSDDTAGVDYDSVGHVDMPLIRRLHVPREADFYLCGPPLFLRQLTEGLKTWAADSTRIHLELFGPEEPVSRRNCAILPAARSLAPRRTRHGPSSFVRPKRADRSLGLPVFQLVGTCRSVRRSRPMVVPHGGLSHLRMRTDRRKCPLST